MRGRIEDIKERILKILQGGRNAISKDVKKESIKETLYPSTYRSGGIPPLPCLAIFEMGQVGGIISGVRKVGGKKCVLEII